MSNRANTLTRPHTHGVKMKGAATGTGGGGVELGERQKIAA